MGFRLRPGKSGIEIRLHELEARIMDLVWEQRLERFAVSEVQAQLCRLKPIAYTTVMTTLTRLHDKGLLDRSLEGKRYLYSPRLSREGFLASTARTVLDEALGERQALAMLAEKVSEASSLELDALEALIQKRRRELGS